MLKYLWEATFQDGHVIKQPADDKYSKHDDKAAHNPSAFRDILDYQKKSPLMFFALMGEEVPNVFAVSIATGEFYVNNATFHTAGPPVDSTERKLIYYRTQQANLQTGEVQTVSYNFGYEIKDINGKNIKKVVTIRG